MSAHHYLAKHFELNASRAAFFGRLAFHGLMLTAYARIWQMLGTRDALTLICGTFTAAFTAFLHAIFYVLSELSSFFAHDVIPRESPWPKDGFSFGEPVGADSNFVWRSLIVLGVWVLVGMNVAHFAFARTLAASTRKSNVTRRVRLVSTQVPSSRERKAQPGLFNGNT